MKDSDLVSNSSLGRMTPDDVMGLVQDRLAGARTGLMHVQMHQQLLERAVAAECARCLRIIEKQCVEMATDESKKMDQARAEGRVEAEMFFGHGSWAASELGDRIYKEINGASMEDPIADETERCAKICDKIRQIALRQTVGDMAHANGVAVGAGDCARRIRGER